jgi:hypothetical protein
MRRAPVDLDERGHRGTNGPMQRPLQLLLGLREASEAYCPIGLRQGEPPHLRLIEIISIVN